jgi:hypothetical protein
MPQAWAIFAVPVVQPRKEVDRRLHHHGWGVGKQGRQP